jgi:hypothetical protein
MAGSTTTTIVRWRLAAPDRHPSKRPVTLSLCPFDVRRPAATMRERTPALAAEPTI